MVLHEKERRSEESTAPEAIHADPLEGETSGSRATSLSLGELQLQNKKIGQQLTKTTKSSYCVELKQPHHLFVQLLMGHAMVAACNEPRLLEVVGLLATLLILYMSHLLGHQAQGRQAVRQHAEANAPKPEWNSLQHMRHVRRLGSDAILG